MAQYADINVEYALWSGLGHCKVRFFKNVARARGPIYDVKGNPFTLLETMLNTIAIALISTVANAAALFYIPSKPLLEDPVACLQTTTAVLFAANLVTGILGYETKQGSGSVAGKAAEIQEYSHVRPLSIPPHRLPRHLCPQDRRRYLAQSFCGTSVSLRPVVLLRWIYNVASMTLYKSKNFGSHADQHQWLRSSSTSPPSFPSLAHGWVRWYSPLTGTDRGRCLAHLMCHWRVLGPLLGARGRYDRKLFAY
ncbi:hypothetical protein BC937DRAFT_86317 [Endogone sp. FLAS-F59071]|nr:hypothetical protein BC937DRAFT_86317 [Endogone sp. FLAS-F59071]|eukprot:RUS20129.1 hypothetical protein BC937DRAFT_86317 [Endogone sp. FLAS-F59071]